MLTSLGRAFGAALIFSLPLMMTMEMWELGVVMNRWRLVLLIASSFPMLMFLSHFCGFEPTWDWREDARDVSIAYGIGIATSVVILFLIGGLTIDMPLSEIAGKVALQTVPAALGALLGRSQLGQSARDDEPDDAYAGELAVMASGAMFLGLTVAPTDEIVMIAQRMGPLHQLLLVPFALLVMHGFVYAAEFRGGTALTPDTPWWSAFLRFTVVGYVLALAVSIYVLWIFGRFEGASFAAMLDMSVVLSFPAAVGASAARLIL